MSNIIPIAAGDLFSVYGTVGYIDYSTAEDTVERAFLDQLTAHDISYTVARVGANDIAAVPGPETLC